MTGVIESQSEDKVKTILDSKLIVILAFNVLSHECLSVDFLFVLF